MELLMAQEILASDREMAEECIKCELCRNPEKQGGLPSWSIKLIERFCPYRPGYEKVYGCKPHQVRCSDASRMV